MMHLVISCLFKGIYIYISTIHSTRLGMEGGVFFKVKYVYQRCNPSKL